MATEIAASSPTGSGDRSSAILEDQYEKMRRRQEKRDNIQVPQMNITPGLYREAYVLATNPKFQSGMIGIIFINSILMGVQTFSLPEETQNALNTVDQIILVMFTLEAILNVYVHGVYRDKKQSLVYDPWLFFDVLSVSVSWLFSDLQIVRTLRIFRALRLFGRVKSLKNIVSALLNTGPKMLSIVLVLGLIFYIFAVIFTQNFRCSHIYGIDSYDSQNSTIKDEIDKAVGYKIKNKYDPAEVTQFLLEDLQLLDDETKEEYETCTVNNYFERIDITFMTLFMLMNFTDWAAVIRDAVTYPSRGWAWVPIALFMIFSSLIMLNLVIAVLCDALSAINEEDEKKENEEALAKKAASEGMAGEVAVGTPEKSTGAYSEAGTSATISATSHDSRKMRRRNPYEKDMEKLRENVKQLGVLTDHFYTNLKVSMNGRHTNAFELRPDTFAVVDEFPTKAGFFYAS